MEYLPTGGWAVSLSRLGFGPWNGSGGGLLLDVIITNKTGSQKTVNFILENGANFTITVGGGVQVINNGASLTMTIRFDAVADGDYTDYATDNNDNVGLISIELFGKRTGTQKFSLFPTQLDFGNVIINADQRDLDFYVYNSDVLAANITVNNPAGGDSTQFSVVSGGGGPYSVGATSKAWVRVRFSPTSVGAKTTTITINCPAGNITITLNGVGVDVQLTTSRNSAAGTIETKVYHSSAIATGNYNLVPFKIHPVNVGFWDENTESVFSASSVDIEYFDPDHAIYDALAVVADIFTYLSGFKVSNTILVKVAGSDFYKGKVDPELLKFDPKTRITRATVTDQLNGLKAIKSNTAPSFGQRIDFSTSPRTWNEKIEKLIKDSFKQTVQYQEWRFRDYGSIAKATTFIDDIFKTVNSEFSITKSHDWVFQKQSDHGVTYNFTDIYLRVDQLFTGLDNLGDILKQVAFAFGCIVGSEDGVNGYFTPKYKSGIGATSLAGLVLDYEDESLYTKRSGVRINQLFDKKTNYDFGTFGGFPAFGSLISPDEWTDFDLWFSTYTDATYTGALFGDAAGTIFIDGVKAPNAVDSTFRALILNNALYYYNLLNPKRSLRRFKLNGLTFPMTSVYTFDSKTWRPISKQKDIETNTTMMRAVDITS